MNDYQIINGAWQNRVLYESLDRGDGIDVAMAYHESMAKWEAENVCSFCSEATYGHECSNCEVQTCV